LEFEPADQADDIVKLMSLDELEERFSDKRVKFVAKKGEISASWIVVLTHFVPLFSCAELDDSSHGNA